MKLQSLDGLAGLDTPDGTSFKPDRRGVIDVPDRYDRYAKLAATAEPFRAYRPQYAGFDAAELRARYEAWLRDKEAGPWPR